MFGIIESLQKSNIVKNFDVVEWIDESTVTLIKLMVNIIDETVLYITELETDAHQKYSYHWQRTDGEMIIRWDNSPHHKNLKTFPHHKHEKSMVLSSHRITIEEVLEKIRERIYG